VWKLAWKQDPQNIECRQIAQTCEGRHLKPVGSGFAACWLVKVFRHRGDLRFAVKQRLVSFLGPIQAEFMNLLVDVVGPCLVRRPVMVAELQDLFLRLGF